MEITSVTNVAIDMMTSVTPTIENTAYYFSYKYDVGMMTFEQTTDVPEPHVGKETVRIVQFTSKQRFSERVTDCLWAVPQR